MPTKGIIYFALGQEYLDMAVESAVSILDNYCGQLPQVIIYSDIEIPVSLVMNATELIQVKQIPIGCYNAEKSPDTFVAWLKTRAYELSPFDQTLVLDCDTRAVSDLSRIWSYCGDSIAVSRAFNPIKENATYSPFSEEEYTQECLSVLGDFTQYNTGVFMFGRSKAVKDIFDEWSEEWMIFQKHENMAFNRLVAKGMAIDYLLPVYNDFYPNRCPQSVLVHYIGNYKKYLNDYLSRY